jgi:hypothetical protein
MQGITELFVSESCFVNSGTDIKFSVFKPTFETAHTEGTHLSALT